MKSKILASIALASACVANAVTVSSVTARQRWPWSAMMDIDFTLADASVPTANYLVQVTATYANGTESVVAKTFANEPVFSEGTHRLVWNLGRDLPNVKATDFTVTVTATPYAESTGSYLVFDLSGGKAAKSYPHWYSSTPPEVLPNTAQKCKTTEMWFRRVPAGTIMQGNGASGTDTSLPAHSVTISTDYYVAIFETTQQQWYQIFGEWKGSWSNEVWRAARPVEYIDKTNEMLNNGAIRGNWYSYNAQTSTNVTSDSFVGFLRSKTGFGRIDLPTEAQWEYAARGGQKSKGYKYSGSSVIDEVAWTAANSNKSTHPVKQKMPNELGLYDMSGNVFEFCSDWFNDDYYSVSPKHNPTGPSSSRFRIMRGGCWGILPGQSRVSCRWGISPRYCDSFAGFRVICVID